MNTESLKTFLLLANNKNFTKTAQALFVAQSTVSGRIRELETLIGKPLFYRTKQTVSLTPVGSAFQIYARQIMDIEDRALSSLNMIGQFSGFLHITAPYNLFDSYVSDLVEQFMADNPDIAVKVTLAHSEEIIPLLQQPKCDLAFLYSTFHNPSYIQQPFMDDPIVLATSAKNTKYASGITVEQIAELPFVYSQLWSANYDWILPEHRSYPFSINIISKQIPYIKASSSYAFFPRKIIERELIEGSLVEIPILDINLPVKPSYVVYKNEFKNNPALVRFIDAVRLFTNAFPRNCSSK